MLALSACEVAGAFLGGLLVWVVYLPHFKTIPEPPPEDERDDLLCTTGEVGFGLRVELRVRVGSRLRVGL